ncbi:MAG: hypothetical protein ACTSR0_04250 [Candidatus Asgardarchaeia archaeon]
MVQVTIRVVAEPVYDLGQPYHDVRCHYLSLDEPLPADFYQRPEYKIGCGFCNKTFEWSKTYDLSPGVHTVYYRILVIQPFYWKVRIYANDVTVAASNRVDFSQMVIGSFEIKETGMEEPGETIPAPIAPTKQFMLILTLAFLPIIVIGGYVLYKVVKKGL